MKYNYAEDLVMGHSYEKIFKDYLTKKGINPNWIETAPVDTAFSDWDIKVVYPDVTNEFEEVTNTIKSETYEVKRDRVMERTGNLCIEMYSHKEKGLFGWFKKTKAHYLVIFDTDNSFITLPMKQVQELWYTQPQLWFKKEIVQDAGYTTINWVCSLQNLTYARGYIEQD